MSSLMIVAGDPSGDRHASRILAKLNHLAPNLRSFGIGGPCMQQQGFEPLMPFAPFNKMGLVEVLRHLPFFLRAKISLVKTMGERRPKALLCVDYPGFNISMMKAANRLGIPVIWYIVPQVWAWKRKRAQTLGKGATFIGTVFPFEVDLFTGFSAEVQFVGHPLMEDLAGKVDTATSRASELTKRAANGTLRIALIPGSRHQEVTSLLDPLLSSYRLLHQRFPGMTAILSCQAQLPRDLFRSAEQVPGVILSSAPLAEILGECDIALVKSGTSTLETALIGVPMIIVYRTSHLTYEILRRFVQIDCIGLPNIVAGKKIVPECIQSEATPAKIALELMGMLSEPARLERMSADLAALKEKLAGRNPSEIMARKISELVGS